jgi:hypothetical protein
MTMLNAHLLLGLSSAPNQMQLKNTGNIPQHLAN